MPAFCPPNITLSDIWVNHGVSHCFVDTVAGSTIAGFIFIFGIAQLVIYKKYSTRIDIRRIQPSFLYKLQIFLMVLLPILVATRLELQWKYYENVHVYGYMVSCHRFSLNFKFIQFPLLLDSLRVTDNLRIFIRDLPGRQGASLSAPFSASSRSQSRPADLLHPRVHLAERLAGQHQLERLVVQLRVQARSHRNGAVCYAIRLHSLHVCARTEGARNHQCG